MKLRVNFVAGLEKMIPGKKLDKTVELEIPEGTTAGGLLKILGLEDIIFVLVNGRHAGLNQVIQPDDRVALYPPIAGG